MPFDKETTHVLIEEAAGETMPIAIGDPPEGPPTDGITTGATKEAP